LLQDIASRILRFERTIPVSTSLSPELFLQELVRTDPRCIYYIRSLQMRQLAYGRELLIEYKNTEYPPSAVFVIRRHEEEMVLRNAVSSWMRRLVVILPSGGNFEWTMQCFMKKSVAFYPNLTSYSLKKMGLEGIPLRAYEVNFKYRIGLVMLRRMNMEIRQEVSRLQKLLFRSDMPDEVKCLIAHNYLAGTIRYDNDDEGSPLERSYLQSAYGALIHKRCVCQGFAEAFRLLMNAENIRCDMVSGRVISLGDDGWHAWNIVHLNGGKTCCHVDVTWDAGNQANPLFHFLKGDDFYQGLREWDRFYYSSCADGQALALSAKKYCMNHAAELMRAGIQREWLL